jgi:small subunit ribosomal protein S21
MIKVQIRQNESVEAAIRRFKRQCNQSGLFAMMKEYAHYEKPTSERRRLGIERARVIKRAERMRRIQRF